MKPEKHYHNFECLAMIDGRRTVTTVKALSDDSARRQIIRKHPGATVHKVTKL